MEAWFDHEKLRAYRDALAFVAWSDDLLRRCTGRAAAKGHLDEASTSCVLNIAEGNGKFSMRDRRRYFEIARASALECAGSLDVLVAKRLLPPDAVVPGKELLRGIVSMLTGLMRDASDRVSEGVPEYGADVPQGACAVTEDREEGIEHEHEQEHEHEEEEGEESEEEDHDGEG